MAQLKPTSDTGGIAAIDSGEQTPWINLKAHHSAGIAGPHADGGDDLAPKSSAPAPQPGSHAAHMLTGVCTMYIVSGIVPSLGRR
jgi:hypothetical protein